MGDYLGTVIDSAREQDWADPRTLQKDIGWSQMASCRSYLGYRIRGEWPSDDEENWRAIAGTALHSWMTGLRQQACDAVGIRATFGAEVSYRGIPGHVDELLWDDWSVIDWKFPSLSSAKFWDDPDIQDERFVQPMGYAAGAMELPGWDRRHKPRVLILVAPVDGKFTDWKVYERKFDRAMADAAVERYLYVKQAALAGEQLPKDKPITWCERFCEFYSLCRRDDLGSGMPEITDPLLATALESYGVAREAKNAQQAIMDAAAVQLAGHRGQARGWQLSMTKPGRGKDVPDLEEIKAQGLDVPMRYQPGQPPKLHVSRVRS